MSTFGRYLRYRLKNSTLRTVIFSLIDGNVVVHMSQTGAGGPAGNFMHRNAYDGNVGL